MLQGAGFGVAAPVTAGGRPSPHCNWKMLCGKMLPHPVVPPFTQAADWDCQFAERVPASAATLRAPMLPGPDLTVCVLPAAHPPGSMSPGQKISVAPVGI